MPNNGSFTGYASHRAQWIVRDKHRRIYNKGIGAVLLQEQLDSSLRPCSYYAKTFNKAQRKYPVYFQELLAIAAALNEYRIYIEGCSSFVVITDRRPLIIN